MKLNLTISFPDSGAELTIQGDGLDAGDMGELFGALVGLAEREQGLDEAEDE